MACDLFLEMNNGQKLPSIGLGTWQAKGEELQQALEVAFETGYRYFDTGIFYENQHILGDSISKWISDGRVKREEIFISSTFSIMGVENIEMLLNMTLQYLKIEYIDLFLIQFPVGIKFNPESFKTYQFEIDPTSDIVAVWKKLEDLVDTGKIKGIGMSSFTISQIERIITSSRIKPSCVQIEVHPRLQQQDIIDLCKKNSVAVVGFSPLGSPGYNNFIELLGAPKKQLPDVLDNSTVKVISNKYSKTPAQIILRYAVQRGIGVIPKSINPSRIKENINIFDFSLESDDMDVLSSLDQGPSARIVDFAVFSQFKEHPEYPF